MYVFLPPYTPSSAACALTLPPYLQICSTMVLTDIISDVFALLTPTLIHTCKCPCTPYLHLYPRKSTFTSTHAQAHTSILSFSFPNLSTTSSLRTRPCTSLHFHTYTSTCAHTFPPLDLYPCPPLSFRLLFPDQVVSTLWARGARTFPPHRIGHPAPILGWPRLGDFFTNRVLVKPRFITSEIKPTEQNGAKFRTPSSPGNLWFSI